VAHDKVAEVERQVAGGRHSWILGRESRCCQEGRQMLQEEVEHLGSTLRWKKTGRMELKKPEKQCLAFVQVNQTALQSNHPVGAPGNQAGMRPEEVQHYASCED